MCLRKWCRLEENIQKCAFMVCMALITPMVLCTRSWGSFVRVGVWGACCASHPTAIHIALVCVVLMSGFKDKWKTSRKKCETNALRVASSKPCVLDCRTTGSNPSQCALAHWTNHYAVKLQSMFNKLLFKKMIYELQFCIFQLFLTWIGAILASFPYSAFLLNQFGETTNKSSFKI